MTTPGSVDARVQGWRRLVSAAALVKSVKAIPKKRRGVKPWMNGAVCDTDGEILWSCDHRHRVRSRAIECGMGEAKRRQRKRERKRAKGRR